MESAELKIRRRSFQTEIRRALCAHFETRNIQRQTLYSDRQHGIGGAYPRFLIGRNAVIAVDPAESTSVVNGIMRAALLWAPLARRPITVIVPLGEHQTLAARLRVMRKLRKTMTWLAWDGEILQELDDDGSEPESYVRPFIQRERRPSSFFAHQERWLESNLIGAIRDVIPSIDARHIYPQVPSFVARSASATARCRESGDRNIIDLLTVTESGRLVVIEIKASPDPDLPFQALDYWIAVERHRKAGDLIQKGYFAGRPLKSQPALLVLVAPLLEYHKTSRRLITALPKEVPLLEIGINQMWKQEIKVLRRKGMVS